MLHLENELLLAIVNHGQAERFVEHSKTCGARGGTIYLGKGTATSSILRLLGLGDTSKEVVIILTDRETADRTSDLAVKDEKIQGVTAIISSEEENMQSKWKMVTVIVNAGYADDIMDAARKVGASGGTVTQARGTASPGDARFMGMTIVPEKEMIMILCPSEQAEAIVESITSLKCLDEPGIGIIYTQNVSDFRNLNPKK